ncbi:hypothetical protein JCM14036_21170 [Desulfotomaculum defluvii]
MDIIITLTLYIPGSIEISWFKPSIRIIIEKRIDWLKWSIHSGAVKFFIKLSIYSEEKVNTIRMKDTIATFKD